MRRHAATLRVIRVSAVRRVRPPLGLARVNVIFRANEEGMKREKKERKERREKAKKEERTQREKKELMIPIDAHLESLPHVHEEQKSSKKVGELAGGERI